MLAVVCVLVVLVLIFVLGSQEKFSLGEDKPAVSECLKQGMKQAGTDCFNALNDAGPCSGPRPWVEKHCGDIIKPCIKPRFENKYLKPCYDYCMVECGNWGAKCMRKCSKETGYRLNASYPPPKMCHMCKDDWCQGNEYCLPTCNYVC